MLSQHNMGGTANPVRRPCAAREILELILHSKGIWEEMIDKARLSLAKMLSVANAFEISDFQEDGIEVTRTRRLECNNVTCLLSPGCAGDGQVGREFGKAWPELLHDAADSGLTSPMATFSAHTASPPPPSRTPAGSRASSRHASIVPRTTSARGPLAWGAPRTRTHRSIPAPPTPAGASRLPRAVPYPTPA